MKLLFDENLSHGLEATLQGLFPGSKHLRSIGLRGADDTEVRAYAAKEGFTIVTKDDDFERMATLYGHPPKVLWLRIGNCSTDDIRSLLSRSLDRIEEFESDENAAILIL